jgi:rubrerythrin
MDVEEFDLNKHLRHSARVDLSEVRWSEARAHPVSADEIRCLAYMMDIESHTVVFLRDLLTSRAIVDPEVTAFLSCWAFEEVWHGEAFSRFLGEVGASLPPEHEVVDADTPYPSRIRRNERIRLSLGARGFAGHVGTWLTAALVPDFVALHMAWGAANELTTLTAYHVMIDRTENPVLAQILRAIIKQERRHFGFYRAQARSRLAASRRARTLTRWALEHVWAPVGTGVRPQAETDFVATWVFSGATGRRAVREMDEAIAALPGMRGTRIFAAAMSQAQRRVVAAGPLMPRRTTRTPERTVATAGLAPMPRPSRAPVPRETAGR